MKKSNQIRRFMTVVTITIRVTMTPITGEPATAAANLMDILNLVDPIYYFLKDDGVSKMKEAVKDFYVLPSAKQLLL